MIDKEYSSRDSSNGDYIIRLREGIEFAIGETEYNTNSKVPPHIIGLEAALKEVERVEKWHAIGEDHRN
ncbi:hypothetical protein K8R30_02200 [archaeon]|nr:hypothetical protein [archaeon]